MDSNCLRTVRVTVEVPLSPTHAEEQYEKRAWLNNLAGGDPTVIISAPNAPDYSVAGQVTVTANVIITGLPQPYWYVMPQLQTSVVGAPPPPYVQFANSQLTFTLPSDSPLLNHALVLSLLVAVPPDMAGDAITFKVAPPPPPPPPFMGFAPCAPGEEK